MKEALLVGRSLVDHCVSNNNSRRVPFRMLGSGQIKCVALMCCTTLLLSCSKPNKIIEGDLYFDPFRFGSFYAQPQSLARDFQEYADTVNRATIQDNEKKILSMYEILKSENLLYSPFVDLRLDNDSIIKLYLRQTDYDQIKIFKRDELHRGDKKLRLKVEVKELGYILVLCKKLISIKKVDGQTLQVQRKFRIDDYH